MIKNEKIIRRLTLEERVKLVVSNETYKNGTFSYYEFPIVELMKDPLYVSNNVKSAIFPTRKMAATTWNEDLYESYGRLIGEENAQVSPNIFFRESGTRGSDITEDVHLLGSFVSHYSKGINKTKSKFILEFEEFNVSEIYKREKRIVPYEEALTNGKVNYVLINEVEDIYNLNRKYLYDGRYYAKAKNSVEICKFINGGVDFVYYDGGDYERVIQDLVLLGEKYHEYKAMLKNEQVTEEEFQELMDLGQILSASKLASCCDRILDLFGEVSAFRNKEELGATTSLDKDEVLEKIASESIVLLKNERNVLPLGRSRKVALLGDVVKNAEYYTEDAINTPESLESILEAAEKCELLNCIGYAHGYHKGTPTKENLVRVGIELLRKADVGVIFLHADKETNALPQEQVDFLRSCIYEARRPLVAVVYGKTPIDLSLIDSCAAVVLVEKQSTAHAKAIIDMLVGITNPSGKLVCDLSKERKSASEDDDDSIEYLEDNHVYNYPFGHGLSYTTFNYSHLEVLPEGVRFTISNSGQFDGYDVVQLYVQKDSTRSSLTSPTLKGFKKVFVAKGDAVKVFIPFDDKTFRYYSVEDKCYGIEGGEYLLFIGSSIEAVRLKGSIKLNKCLDEGYGFSHEVAKQVSLQEVAEYVQPSKKMSYSKKITIGVLVHIYVLLSLVILLITNLGQSYPNLNLTIFLIALIILFNVGIIVFYVKASKDREHYKKMNTNDSLTLVMDNISEYEISQRYVYDVKKEEEVIPEAEVEEVPVVTEEEEETEEEEVSTTYENEVEEEVVEDISETTLSKEEIELHEKEQIRLMEEQEHEDLEEFGDEEENVVYDMESSIHAMCDRLMTYSKDRGIIIELSSCRSLVSALLSAHIIILNSKTKELVNDFLVILNDYFGNRGHITQSNETWNSSFFLVWKKDEKGSYVKTDFVNDVHNASKYKNSINLSFVTNVDASNVDAYFKEIIDFANKPSYLHHIRLNQKQVIKIPSNTRFVLVPKDETYLSDASRDLIDASISVELLIRKAEEVKVDVVTPSQLSYLHVLEQIGIARKEFYLSEETWKHIDHFVSEINGIESFHLGNKSIIQIEKYSSLLMECGSDEQDALDAVLTNKLVPLIKTLNAYQAETGERTFVKVFEKHFGKENISKTIRALKKIVPTKE